MFSSRRRSTIRSNSAGGTARTTWCGQLSIATADAVGTDVAAEGLDAVPIGGDGDQAGLGQVAR